MLDQYIWSMLATYLVAYRNWTICYKHIHIKYHKTHSAIYKEPTGNKANSHNVLAHLCISRVIITKNGKANKHMRFGLSIKDNAFGQDGNNQMYLTRVRLHYVTFILILYNAQSIKIQIKKDFRHFSMNIFSSSFITLTGVHSSLWLRQWVSICAFCQDMNNPRKKKKREKACTLVTLISK